MVARWLGPRTLGRCRVVWPGLVGMGMGVADGLGLSILHLLGLLQRLLLVLSREFSGSAPVTRGAGFPWGPSRKKSAE